MKHNNVLVILSFYFLNLFYTEISADHSQQQNSVPTGYNLVNNDYRPCAARSVANRSVICVCNSTYCDEMTREVPCKGQFITYTTSASGSRFKKDKGYFKSCESSETEYFLTLDVNKKYQTVKGFGGAVTDSAGMTWKSLPKNMQKYLIDSYYSEKGLLYNIVRIPIGCSDFSVRRYTYADCPDDNKLEKFQLQKEDLEYKIPMTKEIIKVATAPVYVIGSSWTPPEWMKYYTETNPKCGYLKREHYQTFADYLLKFVDSYEKEGVPIYSLTTSNEPSLATMPYPPISCLGWATKDMGDWIVNNLGPTVRNSKYNKLKILALDDQRYTVKLVWDLMKKNNSKVLDYVDGLAVHYYANSYTSPDIVKYVSDTCPKLFVISTEASAGFQEAQGVDLGAWKNAKKYTKDIIQDLTHDVVGWVDWNICLDTKGGPNVDNNFVDSPIVVDAEKQEFYKQPMYYALGHFSKFIPRGSVRISSESPPCRCYISNVAFLTPNNSIVVVLHNIGDASSVTIKIGEKQAIVTVEADSITTIEFLNE